MAYQTADKDAVIQASSHCVSCGLCLPVCPTYQRQRMEPESPRGRIWVLNAIAKNEIPVSEQTRRHLDACLQCYACERICPANVPFSSLIKEGKGLYRDGTSKWWSHFIRFPWLLRLLAWLGSGPWKWRWLNPLHALIRRCLRRDFSSFLLGRAYHHRYANAIQTDSQDPELFLGCATRLFDGDALYALEKLLHAAGLTYRVPKTQGCCGGLAQMEGNKRLHHQQLQTNLAAFSTQGPILSLASGCTRVLQEYRELDATASNLAERTVNAMTWLHGKEQFQNLQFQPLNALVALHLPCSEQPAESREKAIRDFLAVLPGLRLISFPDNHCCGASGDNFLAEPEDARYYLQSKIDYLQQTEVEIVLSSNTSCAMHFKSLLAEKNSSIRVMHPIELLAQQFIAIQH